MKTKLELATLIYKYLEIISDGYEKGESSEEIIHRFQKDYLASEEKARLCTETVQKEKELLKAFPYKEGYSLYIGIPFCPSTCLYCSFTSYSIDQFENIVQDYLEVYWRWNTNIFKRRRSGISVI